MARQESFLTRSRAGCMVRCKMTQGRVTEVPCLLDLTISLRLSLAISEEQSLGHSFQREMSECFCPDFTIHRRCGERLHFQVYWAKGE